MSQEEGVVCRCGVNLLRDICLCPKKEEQKHLAFSPQVLRIAMNLQKKIDRVETYVNQIVNIRDVNVDISFPLSGDNSLKLLGDDLEVTCSATLHIDTK